MSGLNIIKSCIECKHNESDHVGEPCNDYYGDKWEYNGGYMETAAKFTPIPTMKDRRDPVTECIREGETGKPSQGHMTMMEAIDAAIDAKDEDETHVERGKRKLAAALKDIEASPVGPKKIKDSGARTNFETGAVRDAQGGKGRFDLLPKMTMWALARHFELGCQKYGDRNWEKGIPIQNYMDSAERHFAEYQLGFSDENHLIATIWNLVCMYETLLRIDLGILPPSLDTQPYPLEGIVKDAAKFDSWSAYKYFHTTEETDDDNAY